MKFYVGVTDNNWYHYLASLKPEEVNFWRPSAASKLASLQAGEPFLFKLHSPDNYIVGGGFFVEYTALPLSMAWEVFREENGAPDFPSFAARIGKYQGKGSVDPQIGCIVLNEPFFFDRKDWIPAPADWTVGIQQGKYYDSTETIGAQVWSRVQPLLEARIAQSAERERRMVAEIPEGYGTPYLTSGRLGQKAFSALLLDLYHRRCAITGEKTMPVLQAAHIKPFKEHGPHNPQNGLLLRADVHILFDKGYITVTPDLRVEVSKRIKEEFENGKDYNKYNGERLISFPGSELVRPSREFLEWHNTQRYNG